MDNSFRDVCMVPSYKPSYVHKTCSEPLSPLTYGQLIDVAAETWGDKEAIVSIYQGQRYSYKQIRDKATQLAAGLVELGLTPGDRLGIWGPNSVEWYISRLAAARAGLIAVQIEPAYQAPQLLYSLNKVGVKALILPGNNFYVTLCSVALELNEAGECGVELNASQIPSLKRVIVTSDKQYRGAYKFKDVLNSPKPESLEHINQLQTRIQPDEGCNIQFSSGTTGFPKAVLQSHRALVNNAYFIGKWMKPEANTKETKIALSVQFCHASGTIIAIYGLSSGSTIILPAPMFDARKTLEAIIQERVYWTFATPSLYVDMVTLAKKENMKFPTLEIASYGGAPCTQQLALEIKNYLGVKRLQPLFGMTETAINFMARPDDTLEKTYSTVGCITYHTEAKVIDDEGRMVPMGTPGEICIRGYSVLMEYWGDKEKTEQFKDKHGWAKTGDVAMLMEGGYAKIVGRIKECIIRIGDKIFPAELEEFFQQNPDIDEAQVFGVPDERFGEEICVYIRPREGCILTEQNVVDYCINMIPDYRIPRYIRFTDQFPRSGMGKVIKSKLLEVLQKELSSISVT